MNNVFASNFNRERDIKYLNSMLSSKFRQQAAAGVFPPATIETIIDIIEDISNKTVARWHFKAPAIISLHNSPKKNLIVFDPVANRKIKTISLTTGSNSIIIRGITKVSTLKK